MHIQSHPGTGPLAGVTVLSLAEQLPGPYAGLLLADLGADVILVERPAGGDPARSIPAFFAAVSRNKRSVTLDLKTPSGHAALLDLVGRADVLMEGYSPGTAERLGIGHAQLRSTHPGLVYVSISGYGQTGPYRDRVGHDLSYQGVAGLLADHARAPAAVPSVPLADVAAGMFAALSIVSALHGRQRTGQGTYIDVSLSDSLVSWMTPLLGPVLNGGPAFDVMHSPGYGSFRCADGRVLTLSVAHEDGFWAALCRVLDLAELAPIPHAQRMRDAAALRARVAERLLARPLHDWGAAFDAARVPWSPVHALESVADDPQLQARGMFGQLAMHDGGSQRYVAHPVLYSAWPRVEPRPAPGLGEHNTEVLGRR
ncbi:CaiB/BaiF CoA transferase family protein [Pseudorhodoferax sp.]|uniref:CaiB/BaiF CoA transferase family protein n=1 Tax=Pseudorhodoferax sp. TaxID=1993553 RepID=UPI002DD6599F|nr:CaiB/BaiF CoA-transferase family protein [Pseudorhodoferax sp.]